MASEKKSKSLLGRLVKLALAVAIITFVIRLLPWTDTVSWTGAEGKEFTVAGKLDGDWNSDSIAFVIEPKASALSAGFPAWVRAASAGEEKLELTREGGIVNVASGASDPIAQVTETTWDPGMFTVFSSADPKYIAMAMGLFFLALLFAVTRWWRLLRVVGCETTWFNVMRLTYLGLFFNLVMPGLTGGDVAKAIIVVREHPERRGQALMSVIVDRVIGLMTLATLALVVVLIVGGSFAPLQLPLIGFAAAGFGGSIVYFNQTVRRAVRFDKWIAKLPLGDKLKTLDEAAHVFFSHPVELGIAMLLSLGNHAGAILAVWALGLSFGVPAVEVNALDYFAIVPIANIISSIPVLPGGWGFGELAYLKLFELIGASGAQGTAVSITFRLCQLLLSLMGGLFLLAPGAQVKLDDLEAEIAEAEKVGA
jgi:uncharacterized protein (TIRG00374 family)